MDNRFRYQILAILGMVIAVVSLMLAWPGPAYADSPFTCTSPVRIMPLGDSITKGTGTDPVNPTGYRKPLYQALVGASYNIDFVGNQSHGDGTFDQDHQGIGGYTAQIIQGDIYDSGGSGQNWLGHTPADVILLHIGTNDIINGEPVSNIVDDVETILDKIDQYQADEGLAKVPVILAQIINQTPTTTTVTTYNAALQAMVAGRTGDDIILVDMESAVDPNTQMSDQYHPNEAGYDNMADVWFTALTGILPVCDGSPIITSSANTTAINGQLYSYNVEADGDAPITFTAPISPSGMIINSSSGVITWTPTITGDFPVTVNAINVVGTATQTFTINVTDLVSPSIVSTAITEAALNQFYAYDVEADGTPPLTFSLPVSPTGMSINQDGLIGWTPTMTGSYNVTVKVMNSVGMDSQAFTIDVTDGLVCPADITAFWPLDETAGSTYDDFHDGHDAACDGTGICPTATASGQINGGQVFNGSSTRVGVPASADFNWGQNDSFSIELWMKGVSGQTCNGTSQVFVGRDDDTTAGSELQWWLGCNGSGKAAFQLHATSGTDPIILTSPANINDGSWHHIVAARNDVNETNYLYVDGTEVASTTHTYTAGFDSATQPLNIGWFDNRSGPGFQFNGTLDEIATYNRALSLAEVQSHYNNGQTGVGYCGLIELIPTITSSPVTNGTVGQPYSYNVDASGTPPVTYSLASGSPAGMSIDQNDGQITWTPSSAGDFEVTVYAINTVGTATQTFTINVAGLVAPTIVSTPVTEWAVNHFYVYDVSATGTPPLTFSLSISPTGMSIDSGTGVIEWTPTSTGSFDVVVNAINPYGTATQTFTIDITDELICPTDITAYWDLDETGGATYDESYGGHDATCTGTGGNCPTATTSGQVNGAQVFNGSNTRLNVAADPAFNWTKDSNFSIELWMKGVSGQTCNSNTQVLIGRDDDTGGSGLQWWLGCNNSGAATFQLRDKSGGGPTLSGSTINDGDWHHLVAIRDGANDTNYLYVDGVEADSASYDHTDDFDSAGQPINFGWFDHRSGSSTFQFNGTIDEIVTYDRALSVSEVEHRFAKGLDKLALCALPSITIAKTPTLQSVAYNSTATFNIAVTNTNQVTVTNVQVTDSEAPNCSTSIASLGPGEKFSYNCTKENIVTEFINSAIVQAKTFFGETLMSATALNAATVDIPSSMSVKKTANPTHVTEPGGNVTYTVRISNTSTVDSITINTLTDDIYGNLNTQCSSIPKLILPGGFYECIFTGSVTGSAGYTETGKVTASGADDDSHPITSSSNTTTITVDPGETSEDTKVYLPLIVRQ